MRTINPTGLVFFGSFKCTQKATPFPRSESPLWSFSQHTHVCPRLVNTLRLKMDFRKASCVCSTGQSFLPDCMMRYSPKFSEHLSKASSPTLHFHSNSCGMAVEPPDLSGLGSLLLMTCKKPMQSDLLP